MNQENALRSSRSKFRLIMLAPVLAIIALMCWAFASPVGSSPDDDFHLSSIWCAAGNQANECQSVADSSKRAVPDAFGKKPCFAAYAKQSAACQSSSLDGEEHALITTSQGNFQGLYPPLYYQTMNVLVSPNIEVSVLLMRMLNILLFVGLATVLYVLLPTGRRPSLVWGLAASMVPLGLFLIASNNPGAWAIISAGTLWIALVGYFESSGVRKAALGAVAALSAVLGAGARADSAVYVVIAVLAVVLLTARLDRRWLMAALLPAALAVMAAIFYFSTKQSAVFSSGLPGYVNPSHPLARGNLLFTDFLNVPSLWAGAFGSWGLGWLDTLMPAIVWVGSWGCFAALVFTGLASLSRRKLLAATMILGAVWLFPTYVLVQSGALVGQGVQPRYILPLIIILAGVALLSAGGSKVHLSKGQVVALVSTLSVVNAVALHFNVRRYVTGADVTSWNLNAAVEWWWNIPASPMVVWAVGSLSFAAFLVAIATGDMLKRPADALVPVR